MTVLRNVVEAPVWILGMARAEAEACYRVTPDGRTGGQPRSLSGAAFWRPAAARRNRPLARYGSAVLFDEPILALDPQLVGEVVLRTNTT
jgi:polar amino acid transport system ATP-binding protein